MEIEAQQINARLLRVYEVRFLDFFFSNFLELVGILHFPGAPSIDFHGSCECSAVLQ